MDTITFTSLEAGNARLRAEIAELRELYTASSTKLGTVSGIVGFEPDAELEIITQQAKARMAAVPALNGRAVEAAAKWIEDFWRATKDQTGILVYEKEEGTWARFAHDAQGLLDALRKR